MKRIAFDSGVLSRLYLFPVVFRSVAPEPFFPLVYPGRRAGILIVYSHVYHFLPA